MKFKDIMKILSVLVGFVLLVCCISSWLDMRARHYEAAKAHGAGLTKMFNERYANDLARMGVEHLKFGHIPVVNHTNERVDKVWVMAAEDLSLIYDYRLDIENKYKVFASAVESRSVVKQNMSASGDFGSQLAQTMIQALENVIAAPDMHLDFFKIDVKLLDGVWVVLVPQDVVDAGNLSSEDAEILLESLMDKFIVYLDAEHAKGMARKKRSQTWGNLGFSVQ